MTRQEEIKEAAYEAKAKHIGYGDSVLYAFIDGALWADEHPVVKVGGALKNYERGYEDAIDKACEWLRNNWRNYVVVDSDTRIVYFGHLENDFHKDMKVD